MEEYEFPVTIYKGESEYQVYDEESLAFHLNQGWTIEKPEPVEPPPTPPTPADFGELLEAVTALRAEVADLKAQLPSADMFKAQGQLIAELQMKITKLSKATGVDTRNRGKAAAPSVPVEQPSAEPTPQPAIPAVAPVVAAP